MTSNAESLVADQFDDMEQQLDADRMGMWLFLATELLLFGGMFTGYAAYRWWYPNDFEAVSRHLNLPIGMINTLVLLASSFTMAMAVRASRVGRHLPLFLILTAALGISFLVLKGVEYYIDYQENLVPGTSHFDPSEWTQLDPPASPARVQLVLLFYYIMTGIHAIHLLVAIGLVAWLTIEACRGRILPEKYAPVDVIGLYWHFVDIIWIFLLPLLYLIGGRTLADLHY